MPTIVQTTLGKVTGLWGSAVLLMGNGKVVALKIGDLVHKGDVVLTTQDGIVQLTDTEGTAVEVIADTQPRQTPDGAGGDIDRVIAELNTGTGDSAPAAGLVGGDGAGLTPGYRVDRIAEGVGANNYGQGAAALRTELSQYVATQAASSDATTASRDPATTITLGASTATVTEGGSVVYTATVGAPVTGSPLVIGLSNGQTITIPVGQTTGSSAPFVPRADDAQVQGPQNLDVSVSTAAGGNYQSVTPNGPASVQVVDDVDTTHATLSVSSASVAEGGSLVYTVTLDNAVAGSPLVISLSNGQTITIPVGASSASAAAFAVRGDDAHAQGTQTLNVGISGSSGGNFEGLDTSSTVSSTVTDDADVTTISISASSASVAEGGSVVYTATVNGTVQGSPLVIQLSNGQSITIPVGASQASAPAWAIDAVRADDALAQGTQPYTVGVVSHSGGDFESVASTSTTVSLTDDVDQTFVSLSGDASVVEGGSASYTISLNNAAGTPVTVQISYSGTAADGSDFTGVATVTIPAGASSASFSIATLDDTLTEGAENIVLTIGSPAGGGFESLAVNAAASSVTTTITDNDALAVIDLDGSQPGSGYVTTWTENGSGVSIADADISITDVDSPTLAGATITLTNAQAGDLLSAGAMPAGITATVNGNVVTLSGNASAADYQAAIRAVTFGSTSENPSTVDRTISVVVNDGTNNSAPALTTVHVVAVNDLPEGRDITLGTSEDTALPLNAGHFLINDAEQGNDQSPSEVRIDTLPAQGSLLLNGVPVGLGQVITLAQLNGGQLSFVPAANANGAGYASFTFSVRDADGGFDAAPNTVTIDVAPVPDAPIAADDIASTAINQPVSIAVLANDSDADGDTLSVSNPVMADPTQGSVSVDGAGRLVFSPASNFSGTVQIQYTVTDPSGHSDTATVTVTVGANTDPTGADVTRSIAEDSSYTVTAADLGFNDADAGQSLGGVRIDSLPAAGQLLLNGSPVAAGTIVSVADLNAGHLVFVPAANANGAPYASFGFSVQDSAGAFDAAPNTFTLDVTPVNDAAVITAGSGAVTEDVAVSGGNIATGGTLSITDVDAGEAGFQPQTVNGSYGTFTLGANGAWTYVANNANPAIQQLGAGDVLQETFPVRSIDGTPSSVTVTINGSNDAAVISSGVGTVTEDSNVVGGNIATGGTLTISDADAGQATFTAQTVNGTYGTFTLGANGAWTYTANNSASAIQSLGANDTLTETFNVSSTDGTASTVVVTIRGTNDAAVISSGTGTVTEDVNVVGGNISTGGTLAISDADAGQAVFIAQTANGAYGSFTLGSNGAWTYVADNSNPALQALGANDVRTETFTVSSADGTTSTVVVTVRGSNDAPVISSGTGSVTEDVNVQGGYLTTGGTLTITDSDAGQAVFQPQATAGTYGIFVLSDNGAWVYAVNNSSPSIQALGANATLTETFSVTSADGTSSSVVITIRGTNDAAVISSGTGTVTEDVAVSGGNISTGGTLSVSDVDTGEAVFVAQNSTGTYGNFTLGTNGVWRYVADNGNPALQALNAGETRTEVFNVSSADGTSSTVTVTIRGSNDAAVISSGTGTVTEDVAVSGGNIATGGTLTISDADAGQAVFVAQTANGAYGTFTLGTNGLWTYVADNGNPAIQSLGGNETRTETFTVSGADGTTSTVTVTIRGTNDAAVISSGTGTVTEDVAVSGGNISTGGTLSISDTDTGEAVFTAQTLNGSYGSFTLGTNGVWTYVANNSAPAIQELGATDTLTETFNVSSADGTTSSVVVTIRGTNDAAVISSGTGTVTEDSNVVGGNISTGGTLTISDTDAGQAVFTAQTVNGTYGTFTLGTNGAWTYVANNSASAIQALGANDTLTDSFNVSSADGTSSSVVVTIRGTNDAAVISSGTGTVTEDTNVVGGNISTGGTLTVTDTDAGQAVFTAQTLNGTYGTFTLGANGVWTYVANNSASAIQELGANDTLTETFNVSSADGTTSSVVVTIRGTNDAAVVSSGTGTVTEDTGVVGGNISTGGTLTVSDTDAGQAVFTAQTVNGAYGTFTLGANGAWTYVANNSASAIQELGASDTLSETFNVSSADGTTSSVVVTIRGTNDAAVISSGTGTVTEDVAVSGGNISTGGTLTISDTDTGQAVFTAQTVNGTYGTFTLGANGVWTYVANNSATAIQALGANDTLTETFSVSSTDGTTSSVVVTIRGSNDAAVVSSGTGTVTEDVAVSGGNIATGGTLTVSDTDTGQAVFTAQTVNGTYGTFTLGANGVWTYVANNGATAIQQLGVNDTLSETFNVSSADGTPSTVTVTIRGSNDAAVISSGTGTLTEDVDVAGGNISTGGTLTISDADLGQAVFVAQTANGAYGTFTLGTNGVWTYVADNSNPAIQSLGANDTRTETFTVASADGTTSSVVVTIRGSYDSSVVSSGTGTVTEDTNVVGGNIATSGTLTISTPDAGQATFVAQTTNGAYGSFTLDADGDWTYVANNDNPAIQALGANDTRIETFNVAAADGTPTTVVITIRGTNDAAVVSSGTGTVTEDVGVSGGNISTGGTLTVTDTDAGQAVFTAQTVNGAYGTFTLGTNGVWTYVASNSASAIQSLGANDTLTETFNVSSADGTTSSVVVTIRGTNDAAVISAGTGTVTEDVAVSGGNISTGGTLTIGDTDAGQATFTAQTVNGTYGTFTLGANGVWTYVANNSASAIQALGANDTLTETFSVSSVDGTSSSVVVTIRGTNDSAVVSSGTGTVTEDSNVVGGNISTGGTLTVSDTDAGQAVFTAQTVNGSYGTFTLGTNGVWTYVANNGATAIQQLGANDTLTETFNVSSADGTASTVVVTIRGTNDAAVISSGTGTVTEDVGVVGGNISTGGTLTISDTDAGQAVFTPQTVNGSYGTFTLGANGVWSYVASNSASAIQALGANDTLTETFNVAGTDGTASTVVVTIRGTNDAAVISSGTGTVTEDSNVVGGNISTGGTLTVSDTDAGQAVFTAQTVNGSYGTFTLGTNGVWTYVASNSATAIQALGANDTLTETFSVSSADGTTSSVVVTIRGTNDAAVISSGTGTVTEDSNVVGGNISTGGTLTVTDADAGQAVFTAQTLNGTYGTFTLGTNGVWTYVANNGATAIQQLGANDTLTETFNVSSADGTSSSVVVTIRGANDAAVISSGTGTVTEDVAVSGGNISTGGTLTVSDTDAGQATFTAQTVNGTYGTFTLGANGVWTYVANNSASAIQALGANDTLSETFNVSSADGTASTVTVTIRGTNDAAVISSGTGTVTEDVNVVGGNISTGGTLTVTDTDAGQAVFTAQTVNGTYGTFTLGTNGAWTYVANNSSAAIQALGANDTRTETFSVASADGTTSSVVVTIRGTNDAAVISSGSGTVTEDSNVVGGNISTGGTLTVTDTDAGQAVFTAQTVNGAYGTFTLGTNGVWTYVANNSNPAIQQLGATDTRTETFTVSSADGTSSNVTVTIRGTNDAAVVSSGTGSVTEDTAVTGGNISTGGTLTVSDTDSGQATFQAQASTAGAYGSFTLGTNGVWTYTANNSQSAIQQLGAGQTLQETFTVRSADGTASSVVITINGTNDAAVVSSGTGSVTEDVAVTGGNISTGGTLTVTDTDTGQATFQAQASTAGTYGTFTLGTNGVWTYTANNSQSAIQQLGAGQTLQEIFTVRSADGTASSVVVTINGTNDAAVISSGTGSVTEDVAVTSGNIRTSGTLTVTDTDTNQGSFQAQASTAGNYGTFTLGTNGAWTYTASNSQSAIQALGAGQTLQETFTVRSADGTASSVVVTINGTNDAAVISSGTGSVTEDVGVSGGNIATSGTLTVTDADSGQATFQAQASTAGTYGTFTLNATGAWTYTANNSQGAIQQLGAGQTLQETFTVRSADGTASSVVVTINGTNDVAVVSSGTGAVTEDVAVTGGNIATGGTLTVTDTDSGQATFQAQASTAGSYGTFTLGTNGVWTYTANNSNSAIQALGAGQTLQETFTVRSADGTASSVVVTINGTNDVAVISSGTGTVTEDVAVSGGNISTGGTLVVTDTDTGQATFQAQASTTGTYGTFTLGTNGAWTYTANNSNSAIQQLGTGQTLQETFTVRSADGTASSVVVTINGTNDVAVISSGTGTVTEDVAVSGGNISTGGTLTVSDTDAGQAVFTAQTVNGTYGTFTIGSNGVWNYVASNSNAAIQALGASDTRTETFSVSSADGTTSSVTVTIRGTNDAAVISSGTGAVTEDTNVTAGNISTGGTLTVTDTDAGQATFQAQASTAGTYGTFTLGTNGVWTYTANNSNSAIQALGAGQTLQETFTVRSADGTASSVVVTINGTNDVAVISSGTGSVTEDVGVSGGNMATGGTLTVTDTDTGQATFQAQASTAGTYGTFTLGTNGVWTYTANNSNSAIQALGTGQTLQETFTVRSADGTASSVVVTINGTNDAAVISSGTGSVTEDVAVTSGNIRTSGTLTVTDTDTNQASFQAQASTAGNYGTFTLGTNGAWTYTASNSQSAIQALGAGQTLTETFSVRSADGTASSVVVTINGTNDAPVATGGSVTGTEDTALVLSWSTFGITDVDSASTSLGIKIATLPADGTLQTWNGTAWTNVSAGQTISKTSIDSGFFRLVPDANESGSDAYGGTAAGNRQSDYTRFNITPTDGSTDGAVATVRIDITPVTDAPVLTHNASTQVTGTLTTMTSIGLSRDYYQDVQTLTSGASSSAPNTGEIGIETAVPTSSSTITNIGVAGTNVGDGGVQVDEDDAYRIQGLIYLEAGKSYTFSGYADDTSRLEIGGNTLMSGQWGGSGQASAGTFTATTFTPTATGYYSLEFMVYNTSGPGSYDLNVSVNGAAAVDVSTANFYLYQSITQVDSAGAQRGAFVANTTTGEGGYYPVTYDAGVQSKVYLAPIVVNLTDTDGSETLAVQLQNIAVGAIISDGTRSFTATAATTSVVVTGWDLSRLSVTMPSGFSGTVTLTAVATATETATGATAATTLNIPVTIDLNGALAQQAEANTYNADALIGLAGADTFTVSESGNGLSVTVSQGASGSVQALTGTETTATTDQVFSTGGGNDFVQAGAGDDTIYLGDSGNSNHPSTGAAPTAADIAATRLMTLADGSVTSSSTGLLTSTADNTSSSNNTAINTWADVANAGSGNDVVYGQGGTDLIYGGSGNDYLNGGAGNDGLRGGAGNDILVGGAGNDVLRGDAGADVFRWEFADRGTAGTPAADIIMDFDTATPSNGGDVLDLRDLLQGEAAGNLSNYLHFSVSGGNTTIQISSTGAFSTGFANNKIDQTITLQNVDLTASGTLTTDQQIINDLMNKSKLLVDGS